ncbi:GGDEF domain-containing protein [Halioglobus japonicus]|uniref:HAMP domain-containing protein n=1 Tax=Halioglobus japonicus TaxID=930805 RepID=A0AAP8SMX5_9GAMM|nr:EAL domain-containing protein [Halioglobus japonicus]AQA18038.1 GGDEF domain-containing protein [Halioglobus japonicus]PLW86027.1 HAMP domain-containing protein [Halioglobus japonicus]GHD14866.1 GGDEF domain-containing protein [Halioglobus japonicus]
MSLRTKLWLAIIALLLAVFSGSFLVSMLSAKSYLEQQISMKNADNAAALALSLTQQGADEVLLELTLSAQFDTGFYELIELLSPEGEVLIRRHDTQSASEAPAWFVNAFPLNIDDGAAVIQSGWSQVGTLNLRSHSRFAYDQLWQSTQILALIFVLFMLVSCLIGGRILQHILKPLDDVVDQAQAIGERRFIRIPEPKTLEFKQVVSAMNDLSGRIKGVLEQEAERLQKYQQAANFDKVTGLSNREPFLKEVAAALESDDVNATGSVSLVRIRQLAELNQQWGRATMDSVLQDIGAALQDIVAGHSRWSASRLNGSDFALLAPRAIDPQETAELALNAIGQSLDGRDVGTEIELPTACTIYAHGDTISTLLTRLDNALQKSEEQGGRTISVTVESDSQLRPVRQQLEDWRAILEQAFAQKSFSLDFYPVLGLQGQLIHNEAPVRLLQNGERLSAGVFLPWVNRLEVSLELDKTLIQLALDALNNGSEPIAANLSVAAVVEPGFLPWLEETLAGSPEAARKLCLELPEAMAFRHLERFKPLCHGAKAHGVQMGIEHVGHQLAELGKLSDIGLDYLKIDASFVRDINDNAANQTLLRTLCTVGHSIGVSVYAEGVNNEAEWKILQELGADGATGPGMRTPG